tara:strand:- start:127498 stop:128058 length:561 start_codon:yes stop_codon:yes gene_type:complete
MSQFTKELLKETPGFVFDLMINIPLMHLMAILQSPRDILAILVVGPIAGFTSFLTNPKSLGVGLVAGLAASFLFPVMPIISIIAIGLGMSFLTSTIESLVVRTQNRIKLEKGYDSAGTSGLLAYYGRKELVEDAFPRGQAPTGLGPMSKAIYNDFQWANSASFKRPYNTYSDTHHIPENLGGFRPR